MIITDRVSVNSKWYVNPRQGGKAVQVVSEVKFVEDLLNEENNVKEIFDRWKISYHTLEYDRVFIVGMFFKYGYTMLRLNKNETRQWVYENYMSVIDRYFADYKAEELRKQQKEYYMDSMMRELFDSSMARKYRVIKDNVYLRCFGEEETIYTPDFREKTMLKHDYISRTKYGTLNEWEFDIRMRPLQFEEPLYFYEDELMAMCNVCDDMHELACVWQMMVKAKQFESSRKWYEDRGFQTLIDSRHWWTPVHHMLQQTVSDLGIAPSKSHTYQPYTRLYPLTYGKLMRAGLIKANDEINKEYKWLTYTKDSNGAVKGATGTYSVKRDGKFKQYDGKITKERIGRIKGALCSAYRPTFLTLQKDETPVITLDYYEMTHGFVFELYEFLSAHKELRDKFLEGNKVQIKTCSECGHRFMVILDGEKGRAPKHCAECGTPKAKMKRQRKAKKTNME